MDSFLYVVLMFLCWLVPSALFKQWYLFNVFLVFGLVFGGMELYYWITTGSSISELFWEFSKIHKMQAGIILGGMLVGWIMLLIHLGKKLV